MSTRLPGIGLDIGTGFLVSATMDKNHVVQTKSVRDAFLEIKPPNKLVRAMYKKSLTQAGISFLEGKDAFYVLGNESLEQSVEKQQVLKRPMNKGVISPKEAQALPMFKALLGELLGEPVVPNEKVLYSVPASPTDAPFDVVYHEQVIEDILRSLGFEGTSINEAHAIVFAELDAEGDDYTGIALSFGSGMVNIAISSMAELVCSFALAKGGDYIDYTTATSLGFDPQDPKNADVTPNLVTYVKEQGVNLLDSHEDRIKIGISAHYKNLIKYAAKSIASKINNLENKPKFLKPIKVCVSGGTSLAPGFIELFKEALLAEDLPFSISEVFHASNPLTAVATGALIALQLND